MSIHNLLVPNNLKIFLSDVTVTDDLIVDGAIVTDNYILSNSDFDPSNSRIINFQTINNDGVGHILLNNNFSGGTYDLVDFIPYDATDNIHRDGRIDVATLNNTSPQSADTAAIYFEQGLNIGAYNAGAGQSITVYDWYNYTHLRSYIKNVVVSTVSNNLTATGGGLINTLTYSLIDDRFVGKINFANANGVTVTASATSTFLNFSDIALYNAMGSRTIESPQLLRDGSGSVLYILQRQTSPIVQLLIQTPSYGTLTAGAVVAIADASGNRFFNL